MSQCMNKMKNNEYHTSGTIPKSNIKIVERGKFDTINKQIRGLSLFWLCTAISIICGRVKLVLWVQTAPLSEMMQLFKVFPHIANTHI